MSCKDLDPSQVKHTDRKRVIKSHKCRFTLTRTPTSTITLILMVMVMVMVMLMPMANGQWSWSWSWSCVMYVSCSTVQDKTRSLSQNVSVEVLITLGYIEYIEGVIQI